MSIYSSNRTGIASLADVCVNESYTDGDISTILYETECNDMAFFEAILYSDLTEIRDLREGVITEAEAEEKNEKDTESATNKIVEKLKKFWAKIKGFFKSIVDKIVAFCDGDGVKLKHQIMNALKEKPNWKGSINFNEYDFVSFYKKCKIAVDFNDLKKYINTESDAETGRKAVNKLLAESIGDSDATTSNFAKKCVEKAKTQKVINKSNINDYLDTIATGRILIKTIKLKQKELEASINDFLKEAKNGVKEHSSISKLNKQASTLETYISVASKGLIAVTKANISSVRVALGKALANINNYGNNEAEAEEAAAVAEMAIVFA